MDKMKETIENYKSLSRDIKKIDKQTAILKKKKKELEKEVIEFILENKGTRAGNVLLVKTQRKEAMSYKSIKKLLEKFYKEYYDKNKKKFQNKRDKTSFCKKKSDQLVNFIFDNRDENDHYYLKLG